MLVKPNLTTFPTYAQFRDMWAKLSLRGDDGAYPSFDAFLSTLRKQYLNGAVINASFVVDENDVFDFLVAVGNYGFLEFPNRLFALPVLAQSLPKLQLAERDSDAARFEQLNPFTIDGELASWLWAGGAYTSRNFIPAGEAMRLATNARHVLIQDRFDEVDVFVCHVAWTPFFKDVAWDSTWVVLDKRFRRLHLIFATDTD